MHTRLLDRGEVMQTDAAYALRRLEDERKFDFVFMDPPYEKGLERQMLELLSKLHLLKEEGMIIVEAAKETSFGYTEELGFSIIREKVYKTNKHIFLEWRKGE